MLSFRHFVVPSKDLGSFRSKDKLPYARPYKPRLVYFYPTFHSGLCCRVVSIADNLCTKKGNSSLFFGLKSAVYNQEPIQIKSGL